MVPQLGDLHSGLLLASLVLLITDVLIDVGMSAINTCARTWQVLRTLRASMKRDTDGSVVAVVRITAPSDSRAAQAGFGSPAGS
ncbi:hypothetical protein ACFWC5_41060 [Streptomyces sp. NPDC060085]|uniref:hypothetical protein n=1 Tax=Streptomyces sp. NPDC060085 TaxID=3347054 RepID=UPI00365FBDA3